MRCVSGCSLRTWGCSPRHLRLQASSSWAACSSCSSPSPRPSASSELAARSRRGRGEIAAARLQRGRPVLRRAPILCTSRGDATGRTPRTTQDPWPLSHIVGSPHGAPLAELCPRPCLSIERGLAEECCVPEVVLLRAVVVFLISKRPPRERAEMRAVYPLRSPSGPGDEYDGCERNWRMPIFETPLFRAGVLLYQPISKLCNCSAKA